MHPGHIGLDAGLIGNGSRLIGGAPRPPPSHISSRPIPGSTGIDPRFFLVTLRNAYGSSIPADLDAYTDTRGLLRMRLPRGQPGVETKGWLYEMTRDPAFTAKLQSDWNDFLAAGAIPPVPATPAGPPEPPQKFFPDELADEIKYLDDHELMTLLPVITQNAAAAGKKLDLESLVNRFRKPTLTKNGDLVIRSQFAPRKRN